MRFPIDAVGLREILETLPGFVIVVDREGTIHYVNRLEEGYRLEDVIGSNCREVLAPDSHEVFFRALEALFESGEAQAFEAAVQLPDGSTAWYRSELFPVREAGEVVAAVLTATNITELRQAQEAVAQLRKLLPICAWCDRIRADDGAWETVESYLKREAGTDVTHGLCSTCLQKQIDGMEGPEGANGSAA